MNQETTLDPCPDCSKQIFPGGQHKCVHCDKAIHTIYEQCSVLLPDEEEDGRRMCIKCSLDKKHQDDYFVVFLEENEEKYCSMVHYNWVDLKLSTVAFPPVNVQKCNMKKTPPLLSWRKKPAYRIIGPFGFDLANKIEINAEDISSTEETEEIVRKVSTPPKRLKKRNSKYVLSVTEEEEIEPVSKPKKKNLAKTKVKTVAKETPKLPEPPIINPAKDANIDLSLPEPPVISPAKDANEDLSGNDFPGDGDDAANGTSNDAKDNTTEESVEDDKNSSASISKKTHENTVNRGYVSKSDFVKFQKQVITHVNRQKLSNNQMLLDDDQGIFKKLPLQTEDDLDKFELELKGDRQKQEEFKMKCQKISGTSIGMMTYRCMSRIMTDKLAIRYSYTGQTKKGHPPTIEFRVYLICKLILRGIVYSNASYTETDCIAKISKWLNDAITRCKKQDKKQLVLED